ncbi:sulfite exporter TauE/SafE family protein [Rhodospirillaceae bacterium SYSU D60014]|uniref:sulfite exporter TauE/SafE family protein n=1 Tax=Virgifigura deserti TaxID=2268457 RepID=UPI0013C4911C
MVIEDLVGWHLVFAGGAVALAGVVRGFAGFGSAMIITPAFSAIYGPAAAVPIGLLMELILTAPLMPGAAPLVEWRRIATLTIAAAVTVPMGAWLLLSLDAEIMRWAISIAVLAFVAMLSFGWRYTGRPKPLATLATGASSGLLNGASGMGGPPIIFYYLSGPDEAPRVRASFIVYFALIDILAIAALWWKGGVTADILRQALLLVPLYLAAAWIGARMFGRANDRTYRTVALVVLTIVAVMSLAV